MLDKSDGNCQFPAASLKAGTGLKHPTTKAYFDIVMFNQMKNKTIQLLNV